MTSILTARTAGNALLFTALCCSLNGIATSNVAAQQPTLAVLVEQLAGANVYIRAGTDDGVVVDDTLSVYDESGDRYLGAFLVVSSSSTRSVVAFLGDPFSVTRGATIQIRLGAAALLPEPTSDTRDATGPTASQTRAQTRFTPHVTGRLSLQLNALESTTRWLSNEEIRVERQFATPALGLRLTATHLPGDVKFTTNLKGSYRYSSADLVQPSQSIRIYQVGLEKSFEGVPIQFQIGRFYNRFETLSGYWDGVLLHYGEKGLGVGAVAGFQPERANEGLNSTLPKYSVFVDFNQAGQTTRYYANVSFHQMLPRDDSPKRTFVGWSQRLTAGAVRLGSDLRVDHDTDSDSWSVVRLHAHGTVSITRGLSLRARYALDRPLSQFSLITLDRSFFKRQQGNAGISYWAREGSFNLDVTANRFNENDITYTYSSSFNLTRTPLAGLGFFGAASYWTAASTKAVNLYAGLNRSFGVVQARASYQLYRTESMNSILLAHTGEAGLMFPISPTVFWTLQARLQRGKHQTANSIFLNLWTNF